MVIIWSKLIKIGCRQIGAENLSGDHGGLNGQLACQVLGQFQSDMGVF